MIKRCGDFTMFLVTFKQARKLGGFKYIEIFQFELFFNLDNRTIRARVSKRFVPLLIHSSEPKLAYRLRSIKVRLVTRVWPSMGQK